MINGKGMHAARTHARMQEGRYLQCHGVNRLMSSKQEFLEHKHTCEQSEVIKVVLIAVEKNGDFLSLKSFFIVIAEEVLPQGV